MTATMSSGSPKSDAVEDPFGFQAEEDHIHKAWVMMTEEVLPLKRHVSSLEARLLKNESAIATIEWLLLGSGAQKYPDDTIEKTLPLLQRGLETYTEEVASMCAVLAKTQAETLTQGLEENFTAQGLQMSSQQNLEQCLQQAQQTLKGVLGTVVSGLHSQFDNLENTCQAEFQKLRSEIRGHLQDQRSATNEQEVEDLPMAKLAELAKEVQAMKLAWHSSHTAMYQDMRELIATCQNPPPSDASMYLTSQLMELRQELETECSERKDSIVDINAKLAHVEPTALQGDVQTASAATAQPGHTKTHDDSVTWFVVSNGISRSPSPINGRSRSPSAAGTRNINGFCMSPRAGVPAASPYIGGISTSPSVPVARPMLTTIGPGVQAGPPRTRLGSDTSPRSIPAWLQCQPTTGNSGVMDSSDSFGPMFSPNRGSRSARVMPPKARVAFSPERTSLKGGAGIARDIPTKDALYLPGLAAS